MVVYYDSLVGCEEEIYLAATSKGLCFISNDYEELIEWLGKRGFTEIIRSNEKMASYVELFTSYFKGEAVDFSVVKMDLEGTVFQQAVWEELQKVQYGEVTNYATIADRIKRPKAVRAVASAIGKNPLLIVIPCHRIIGKNGKLTGFRSGLSLKEKLLTLEKVTI